ncbi:MAG: hypothetical protein L0Z63_11540 [Actinobacteria bacterium]|nr:hypothetical protein [Actinomycetota bacterium]
MSQELAISRAQELRAALLDHGVKAVSIELQPGRGGTPNNGWYDTRFVANMGHHIVSYRSQGLTPGLALVKKGRTDVPGPLCNGYGGFDEVARIICLGWANHPGAGGPYTVPSGVIPANNGRPYIFGWEHEGGILESDWGDSFRIFMGRCHAATLDWLGLDERSHLEHKTWATPPGRKIDRLGYTLEGARAEVVANQTKEDDMWDWITIDDSLVRHAWNQGWLLPKNLATLDYFLGLIPELSNPNSANVDVANFKRAVANGIARSAGAVGTLTETRIRELASSEILRRLSNG